MLRVCEVWRAGPPWVNPARQAGPAPAPAPAALPVGAAASGALETLPEAGDSPPAALARAAAPPLPALPHALAALAAADWPADVRCYAAELHGAEARVAAGLVRLAAQASQLPAAHEERVRRWLSRNEKETGARLPSYSTSESKLELCYMPGTHEERVRRRLSATRRRPVRACHVTALWIQRAWRVGGARTAGSPALMLETSVRPPSQRTWK